MHVEIEAKIKIDKPEVLVQRLESLRAVYLHEITQRDCFFDRADGSLRAADCGLRLREEKSEKTVKAILCYKGPRQQDTRYKQRQEIEVTVHDAATIQELLHALGYKMVLVVEKRRTMWQLQECLVCLDEVAKLGKFIEIEGPDPQTIGRVQELLALADEAILHDSYAAMIADHQQNNDSCQQK